MSFLQILRETLSPPTSKALTSPSGSFAGLLRQMTKYGHYSRLDDQALTEKTLHLALVSSWVWSDVRLIADRVASKTSALRVHQGEEELETHPLYELMTRPNSFMSGGYLKRYLTWWYWLRGNSYLFISTPGIGRGKPEELWPLMSDMVRPLPERLREGQGVFRGREVIDYEYNVNGSLEILPGENVLHWRIPNMVDYWEGMSPLTAARLGMQMDYAQAVWTRDFFAEDNAIPSAIISVPATTSPVDFDRQKELLRQQMKEGQKRLFTRSGDLTVELISQTLEQMEIIDSRRFNRDEIDRVLGIPEGFFTATSGDSRNAAEVAFSRNTIQPTLDTLAEQITADLMLFYGRDVECRAPNVIPQDRALEIQEYTIYSQDKTINENREQQKLEPIKDDYGLADLPVRLLQYLAPAALAPETETEPESGPEVGEEPDDTPDVGNMTNTEDTESMSRELSERGLRGDLSRWRRVALRELKAGRNPAARRFVSQFIPTEVADQIVTGLRFAREESEVKAVFDTAYFPEEWQAYP